MIEKNYFDWILHNQEHTDIKINSYSLTEFGNPKQGVMLIPTVNKSLDFEIRYHYKEYNDKGCYYLFTDKTTGQRYGSHYSAGEGKYFCDGVIPSSAGIGGNDEENKAYADTPFLAVAKYIKTSFSY